MGETLGNYENATAEIVDSTTDLEGEMAREIENEINKVNQETADIAEDQLDNMTQNQLKDFLIARYFKDHSKEDLKYSNIKKSENFLRFSMKAALKFLVHGKEDKTKYNETTGLKVGENDGNGLTADEILEKHGGIDLDEDSVLIKILQDKVKAKVDGKPGAQTIAKVIGALGGDLSEIYQQVNDLYPNNKNLSMENIQTKPLFGTDYNIDTGRFTLANDGEDAYTLIDNLHSDKTYKIVKEGENIIVKNGNEITDEIIIDGGWIKAKNTVQGGEQHETTPQLGLNENDAVVRDNYIINGKGVDNLDTAFDNYIKGTTIYDESNLFIYDTSDSKFINANGLYDKMISSLDIEVKSMDDRAFNAHNGQGPSDMFETSHTNTEAALKECKFTYENGNIKYEGASQGGIDMILERTNNGFKIKGGNDELPMTFDNPIEAIKTATLAQYLLLRTKGATTGANLGNPDYYQCTDNDSPFFVTSKYLYRSDWRAGFLSVDDTDIMDIDDFKNLATPFKQEHNRINFAKFLSRVATNQGMIKPEEEGRYVSDNQSRQKEDYLIKPNNG